MEIREQMSLTSICALSSGSHLRFLIHVYLPTLQRQAQ